MHKKLILTSILAIGVIGAAHAATNTGSFPNDGKMLEDWTYTNAANETNVGVDGGNVNALANYTWNEIALPAGKYLPADTDGLIANLLDCTSGNYCAGTGANTVHYNQSQAQGLTTCPTGFGTSATGATADTDCYRACNINNMTTTSNPNGTIANIAHATQLTGNDYYGAGTDTCEPTQCDPGCRIDPGTSELNLDDLRYASGYIITDSAGQLDYNDNAPSDYGIIGEPNTFAMVFSNGDVIRGRGRCSTRGVTTPWYETAEDYSYDPSNYTFASDHFTTTLADETGQSGAIHCYCQLDGYKPANSNGNWQTLSTPWVYRNTGRNVNDCAQSCDSACLWDLAYDGPDGYWDFNANVYRATMYASVESKLATCEWNMVTVPAGKYLPANTDGLTTNLANCTAGNFCTGLQNDVHYESTAQGLTACSTVGDHTYINSDVGATADTQCYKSCTLANANIAHATAVTGNDYYGAGVDTCVPTECDTGYEIKHVASNLNLNTTIGTRTTNSYAYVRPNGKYHGGDESLDGVDLQNYSLSSNDLNAFAVDYGNYGVIRGHGRCSASTGAASDPLTYDVQTSTYTAYDTSVPGAVVDNLTDETNLPSAHYCYCQLDGYKPKNGTMQSLYTPWVFHNDFDSASGDDYCDLQCASWCAIDLTKSQYLPFRSVLFASVRGSDVACEAKTYNITWADTLAADVTANEAATATYGGNINTPVKIDPAVFQTTQKGKHFTGWTFQQPQQSPVVQDPS